jgi:hypothetical protein
VLGPDGREQPNLSAQVVVLTRWDHQDVIGWLLEQELGEAPQHWTVLDLPAIAEDPAERPKLPPTCTLIPDWRQAGEALCPERFPLPELLKIRARLGGYWWAALYQQRPSPASGSIFLRQWLRPPFPREQSSQRHYALLALSCDLSFKGEAESDYCGFCLAGLLAPPARNGIPRSGESQGPMAPVALEIEVLWAARHRFGLPEVIRCLEALEQQGLRPHAVLIEDAANGPAVLQTLRRRVPGMLPIIARGSKETRAHAVAPLLAAGQIRFHHRAQPLVEEAIRFPRGSKDLVDAFCHGALWLEGRYWKSQAIACGEPRGCCAGAGLGAAGAADHGGAHRRCHWGRADVAATALLPAGMSCPGRAAGDQPADTGTSPAQSPGSAASALQTPSPAPGAAPCRCRCPGAAAPGPGGEDRRQLRPPHRPPQGRPAADGDDRLD